MASIRVQSKQEYFSFAIGSKYAPFISKLILLHCKMETIVAERIAFWPMIYVSDMHTRKVISVDLSEIFMPLYTRGVNLFEAFDKNVMSSIRLFLP